MTSHWCADCAVCWFPYLAKERCPVCGAGIHIVYEPASPDAVERYKAIPRERLRDVAVAALEFDPGALGDEIAALPTFTGERRLAP